MTPVGEDEVRRIAGLARLELEEDEVARLAGELGRILDHVDELRELELDGPREPERPPGSDGEPPEPASDAPPTLRPDVPAPDPMAAGPERAAPDWRDGFFVVPRLPAMEGPDGEAP